MRAIVSARGNRTLASDKSCDSVERSSPAFWAKAARDRPVRSISRRNRSRKALAVSRLLMTIRHRWSD